MITKLSHASIYVLDKDEATRFYTEKLGCTVSQDMAMPNGYRWITLKAPEQEDLEIVLKDPESDESLSKEQVRQMRDLIRAGAFGFGVFKTDDCRKAYETYRRAGAEVVIGTCIRQAHAASTRFGRHPHGRLICAPHVEEQPGRS